MSGAALVVNASVVTRELFPAASRTIRYALYAVAALSPVTAAVFAAANAAALALATAVPCA